jgi:hypothetical protein
VFRFTAIRERSVTSKLSTIPSIMYSALSGSTTVKKPTSPMLMPRIGVGLGSSWSERRMVPSPPKIRMMSAYISSTSVASLLPHSPAVTGSRYSLTL